MSDQYTPQNRPTGTPLPGAVGVGGVAGVSTGPDAYRTTTPRDVPPPVTPAATGMGSGLMVALVFVVVAIIAAVAFTYSPDTGNVDAPAVSIDNNNSAPVIDADPVPAPEAAAPEAAAPMETAPEAAPVTPDAAAPTDAAPTDAAPVDPAAPATPPAP